MNKKQEEYVNLILNQKDLPDNIPNDKYTLQGLLFYNRVGGLHLTRYGLDIMKSFFQCYEVQLSDDFFLTSKNIILLTSKCSHPYHLNGKDRKIYLFEKELASLLILCDGKINYIEGM